MTSHDLIEYLKTHPLISVNRLELKLGISPSTIGNALTGLRKLPKKWIEPLANELKEYGLKINKK